MVNGKMRTSNIKTRMFQSAAMDRAGVPGEKEDQPWKVPTLRTWWLPSTLGAGLAGMLALFSNLQPGLGHQSLNFAHTHAFSCDPGHIASCL